MAALPTSSIALHPVPEHNAALAGIFHQMADCYRYLGAPERFRALAYEQVSRNLLQMPEDIATHAASIASLDEVQGVGESIAEKIQEYLKTGGVKSLEKLKRKVPFELLELLDIRGFGPVTLRHLHEQCGIKNRQDLEDALLEGRLSGIPGLGSRTLENMRRALKLRTRPESRMPYREAAEIASKMARQIRRIPGVERVDVAGSLRRRAETIGDVDLVVQCPLNLRNSIARKITLLPGVEKVMSAGSTKVSVWVGARPVQMDVRLVTALEFGAAWLYFTGNKQHNIHLRRMAKDRGWKINEYGLFEETSGRRLASRTEEEMYQALGLRWIAPQQRLDRGEIEASGSRPAKGR